MFLTLSSAAGPRCTATRRGRRVASPAMASPTPLPASPPASLPHSAVLAWWLTAWLRGHEQTDHVLDALADDTHLLERGLGAGPAGAQPRERGGVRRAGAAGRRRPARPGRAACLQRGGARGGAGRRRRRRSGWCPTRSARPSSGACTPAARRQLPDVGRGRPRAARGAGRDRRRPGRPRRGPLAAGGRRRADATCTTAPRSTPRSALPRAASTSRRAACRRWAIVELALEDDGGALSALRGRAARDLLTPLGRGRAARAGRRVLARGVAGLSTPAARTCPLREAVRD